MNLLRFERLKGQNSIKPSQKITRLLLCGGVLFCLSACEKNEVGPSEQIKGSIPVIINHNTANINRIPTQWIDSAKSKLRIAYGHTSHGSQLTTGMEGLVSFKGDRYRYDAAGTNGALTLKEPFTVDS